MPGLSIACYPFFMRPTVLSVLLLGVTACSSSQTNTGQPVSPAPLAPIAAATAPTGPREGDELLGTKAHPWNVEHWINSPPLTLSDLSGQVVLVRWFMSTNCDLCSATAPTLRAFDAQYRPRGLRVIGMYHHKDPEPLDPARVEQTVRTYGYKFPVAIDPDWRTLKDWWLDGHERPFTSVSFLIDKQGTIRFIHPGGKYEPGSEAEGQLRAQIERLLAE